MKKVLYFIALFFLFSFYLPTSAELNLFVTPIKFELKASPWDSITQTAIIKNAWTDNVFVSTWKINAESVWTSWETSLIEKWNPNHELASWITIHNKNKLEVPSLWENSIDFTIKVPNDATPWWHYWAVFFEYDAKDNWVGSSSSSVSNLKVKYAILILLEVDWEIIDWWKPWDNMSIKWPWWRWTPNNDNNQEQWEKNTSNYEIDKCPYWDFSKSNFDWKCFEKVSIDDLLSYIKDKDNSIINEIFDNKTKPEEVIEKEKDYNIEISLPFVNEWNTHIKPYWKITFKDEKWNDIKSIWVINVLDNNWLIIWEEIADYIPINPEESNIYPNSEREFKYIWKWFPYETRDENWKLVIKYLSPSEFFNQENEKEALYPWNRILYKMNEIKLLANINIAYANSEWEEVSFESAKDFDINYVSKEVWYDPYFIFLFILFILVLFIILLIFKKIKNKKCEKCEKQISKKSKACPHCWAKQNQKNKL